MTDIDSLKAGDYAWSVNYGTVRVFNSTISLYPNVKGVGTITVRFGELYIEYTYDGRRINWDDNGNTIIDCQRTLFLNKDCYVVLSIPEDVGMVVEMYGKLCNSQTQLEEQCGDLICHRAQQYVERLAELFIGQVGEYSNKWIGAGFITAATRKSNTEFKGHGVVFGDDYVGHVYTVALEQLGSDMEDKLLQDVKHKCEEYIHWERNYQACKIKEIQRLREKLERLESE